MSIALRGGLIIATAASLLIAGFLYDPRTTLAAYLVAWTTLAAIPIGALGILAMTYLVRRNWTEALHPTLTAATATLPLAGLLLVPVLFYLKQIYPAALDPGSRPVFQAIYLAPWFFVIRAATYFILWSGLALWLRLAWRDPSRMVRSASVSLMLYALTVSLAGVDWSESVQPDFHSSIYGFLFINFCLLNGLAFTLANGLATGQPIGATRTYSALFLSATLLWAYTHAMQYIVIWSGNIPKEAVWYLQRSSNGWQFLVLVLAAGQFLFPFFLLLSRTVRADRRWLLTLCGLTLAMRFLEAAVLILPPLEAISLPVSFPMLISAIVFNSVVLLLAFKKASSKGSSPTDVLHTPAATKSR